MIAGKLEESERLWFEQRKGTLAAPDRDSCSRMCMDFLVVLCCVALIYKLRNRQITRFYGGELTADSTLKARRCHPNCFFMFSRQTSPRQCHSVS